jgi:hypothetical protein
MNYYNYNILFLFVVVVVSDFPIVISFSALPATIIQRNHSKKIDGFTNIFAAARASSDDPFDIPEPRWECPVHEDICAETGVTLSRYMMEMVRVNPELEEIESSKYNIYIYIVCVCVCVNLLLLINIIIYFYLSLSIYIASSGM